MINRFAAIFLTIIVFTSCEKIRKGTELSKKETAYLHQLGLLDPSEHIFKFYSNFKFKNAGNFFTDKRIAKYWIDKHDSSETEIAYAYYEDIASIDSTTNVPATYCPYLLVTKKDSTTFKVYVNGKKPVVKAFFEEAIATFSMYGQRKSHGRLYSVEELQADWHTVMNGLEKHIAFSDQRWTYDVPAVGTDPSIHHYRGKIISTGHLPRE